MNTGAQGQHHTRSRVRLFSVSWGIVNLIGYVLPWSPASGEIVLQTRVDIRAGTAPTAVAVHDGNPRQIMIAHSGGVIRFQGDRSNLAYAGQIGSIPSARSIALVDLTGDRRADLVSVDGRLPFVQVLPALDNDDFGKPIAVPLPAPGTIVKARPIGDRGKTAVLIVHERGVSVLAPEERGELHTRDVKALPFVSDVEATDVDGDGRTDLILAERNDHRLAFLSGIEGNTMGEPQPFASVRAPDRLLLADVDADKRDDLLVIGDQGVTLFRRTPEQPSPGLPQQRLFAPGQLLWAGSQVGGLAAGDADGDGHLDLVVTDRGRSVLTFLMGEADSSFRLGDSYGTGRGPGAVMISDLNADGSADALALNSLGDSVTYLRGLGGGRFAGSSSIIADARELAALASADFNADGHLDLVVSSATEGTITVFLGDGHGRFTAQPPMRLGGQPRALVALYVGTDPLPDLAVADFAADQVAILPGNGHGGFANPIRIPVGKGPTAIAAGNFGVDGHLDLAIANTLSDSISILQGDGLGAFPEIQTLGGIQQPSFLLVGDVNADGYPDLVVGNERSEDLVVFPGSPHGIGAPKTDALADRVRPLVAEDLDRDGHVDLVLTDQQIDEVSILPGTGQGRFGLPLPFSVGHHPSAVAAGDFDENGYSDLAVLQGGTGTVSILLNATRTATPSPRSTRSGGA